MGWNAAGILSCNMLCRAYMANKLLAYILLLFLSYYTKDNIFASGQFLSGKEKANSS